MTACDQLQTLSAVFETLNRSLHDAFVDIYDAAEEWHFETGWRWTTWR